MKKVILALALGMLLGSAATAMAAQSEPVQAFLEHFNFRINGQEKQVQTTPLVVDGTSYLPVREVAGLLGYAVDFEESTHTIILDAATPSVSKSSAPAAAVTPAPNTETKIDPEAPITKDGITYFPMRYLSKFGISIKIGGAKNLLYLSQSGVSLQVEFPSTPEGNATVNAKVVDSDQTIEIYFTEIATYLRADQLKEHGFVLP